MRLLKLLDGCKHQFYQIIVENGQIVISETKQVRKASNRSLLMTYISSTLFLNLLARISVYDLARSSNVYRLMQHNHQFCIPYGKTCSAGSISLNIGVLSIIVH